MNIKTNHDPYYITFFHDSAEKIIRLASSAETNGWIKPTPFFRQELRPSVSQQILNLVPKSVELTLMIQRVSIFTSQGGLYYQAHKDGYCQFGINYILHVEDELCVTSWYNDSVANGYKIDTKNGRSYELANFNKENHTPVFSTTLSGSDAILFNTGMFHDWDNTLSSKPRALLTLRPTDTGITYEHAKHILFK